MCLAVDPDLLVTVNAMTGGYVVNDAPDAGPGTPTHPGAGQDAAVDWLNRLRALPQRMCVDADHLRAGRPRRAAAGRRPRPVRHRHQGRGRHRRPDPRRHVDARRQPRRRRTADRPAVQSICCRRAGHAGRRSRSAPPRSRPRTPPAGPAERRIRGPAPGALHAQVVAAPFDPAVGAALAGVGTRPVVPSYLDPSLERPGPARLGGRRAARTRSARCCGAACTPTPNRAPRS